MPSFKPRLLSSELWVPVLGLIVSAVGVHAYYESVVRPRATDLAFKQKVIAAQGGARDTNALRSVYVIIQDPEQEFEIIFALWGALILTQKLVRVGRERRLLRHDIVALSPGERIIPSDALDRYKELLTAIERTPAWQNRLVPDSMLAALHRFAATSSVQDAANAVKERAELVGDTLDSSLSLVRYIAWAIPAIGFIGTVRGIGLALAFAEEAMKGDIAPVISALGLAFNSTLVALLISMVLMYFMHVVQSRQEALIIEVQSHCRDRLIDQMKVPAKDDTAWAPAGVV